MFGPKIFADQSLDALGLYPSIVRRLNRAGITQIEELTSKSSEELFKIKDISGSSVRDIWAALEKYGFTLTEQCDRCGKRFPGLGDIICKKNCLLNHMKGFRVVPRCGVCNKIVRYGRKYCPTGCYNQPGPHRNRSFKHRRRNRKRKVWLGQD